MSSETSLGVLFEAAAAVCPELRADSDGNHIHFVNEFRYRSPRGVTGTAQNPLSHIDSAVLNWAEKRGGQITFWTTDHGKIKVAKFHQEDLPTMDDTRYCYGDTRQEAGLRLILTIEGEAVAPAKAEASPEAGTVPPEGMPEALRPYWTPGSRVYRSRKGNDPCWWVYPAGKCCPVSSWVQDASCSEETIAEDNACTIIPAPTPSPAGEADSIEKVAKDIAGMLGLYMDSERSLGLRIRLRALAAKQIIDTAKACRDRYDDGVKDCEERLRRLQPTREMAPSVKRLVDHVLGVTISGTTGYELARAVRDAYATPATAPGTTDCACYSGDRPCEACRREAATAPNAVPVAKDDTPKVIGEAKVRAAIKEAFPDAPAYVVIVDFPGGFLIAPHGKSHTVIGALTMSLDLMRDQAIMDATRQLGAP